MAVLLAPRIIATALAVIILLGPSPSVAAEKLDCGFVVRQIITETHGRLLSVRAGEGQCVISVLIQPDKGRPRKIVIKADPKRKNLRENITGSSFVSRSSKD